MAKPPRTSDYDDAAATGGAEGTPGRDARPAMDTHFLLLEVGKLTHAAERLGKDMEKIDKKLDSLGENINGLTHSVSFVKGGIWAIGIVVFLIGVLITWYINGKLSVSLHPGP
jgi:hypothetical protein